MSTIEQTPTATKPVLRSKKQPILTAETHPESHAAEPDAVKQAGEASIPPVEPTDPSDKTAKIAANLREFGVPSYLSAIMFDVLGQRTTAEAVVRFRNDFLAACGNPTDPVMIMLLEQLLMAHHAIGRLHFKAAGADSEVGSAFLAAATRLTGEFRRTALACQEYQLNFSPRLGVAKGESELQLSLEIPRSAVA